MLVKVVKLTLLSVVGVAFATSALADHHGGPKLGVQYRAGLTYMDNGLDDVSGSTTDPTSETSIDLEAAKVVATGMAAKDVNYTFRYNAISNAIELANAVWMHSGMLSIEFGRDKINQGGWTNLDAGYDTITPGNFYEQHMAFAAFSDVVAFHLALAGKLTLQLTNDVKADTTTTSTTTNGVTTTTTVSNSGSKNTKSRGPATILQWVGNFSGWMPLVQVASYDLNNSVYFVVGLKGKVAGLGLVIDYINDSRKYFERQNGALTRKDVTDTHTGVNFWVDYAVGGFTPFLEYNMYDVKQGTDSGIAARTSDPDGNAAGNTGNWEDNGQAYSVGAICNHFSRGYEPYLAVTQKQGTFFKGATNSTEDLSELMVKLGVRGEF